MVLKMKNAPYIAGFIGLFLVSSLIIQSLFNTRINSDIESLMLELSKARMPEPQMIAIKNMMLSMKQNVLSLFSSTWILLVFCLPLLIYCIDKNKT